MVNLREFLTRAVRRSTRALGYDVVHDDIGRDAFRDLRGMLGSVGTIFDVGANTGQTARDLAQHFPTATIYSFEPDPATFVDLARTVSRLPNVKPIAAALGQAETEATLHRSRASPGNSLLPFARDVHLLHLGDWTEECGTTKVPVHRLDRYCERHGIRRIDILKTDTQGTDLHVIEGGGELMRPAIVRAVFCEVLFAPLYEGQATFEQVYTALATRGYRLVDFYNRTRGGRRELMWCDALFI